MTSKGDQAEHLMTKAVRSKGETVGALSVYRWQRWAITVLVSADGKPSGLVVEPYEPCGSYEALEQRYGPKRPMLPASLSGGDLPVRELRDMPVGDLQRRTVAEVRRMLEKVSSADDLEALAGWARDFATTLRTGRRGRTDEPYAALAALYVDRLGSGHETEQVADFLCLETKTVRNALAEARRRKLLTEPPPGRAGGKLTELCKDLLARMKEA